MDRNKYKLKFKTLKKRIRKRRTVKCNRAEENNRTYKRSTVWTNMYSTYGEHNIENVLTRTWVIQSMSLSWIGTDLRTGAKAVS